MKKPQNSHPSRAARKQKDLKRDIELQAINHILDRRYDVLIELG